MTARPVVETDGLLQNPASAADIPSLDLLLACPDGQALAADYGRSRLAGMLRQLLDEARPQALAGTLAASALEHSVLRGQAKSRMKAADQSRMTAEYILKGPGLQTKLVRVLFLQVAVQASVEAA